MYVFFFFFFSSRRRHTRWTGDWSSDVCSSDLGYNLSEEHPGSFPTAPPTHGGVARMSSYGEGIQATPLQLAAVAAAFANGGTLYYLQYPHSKEEMESFTPKVKLELNIGPILPEI